MIIWDLDMEGMMDMQNSNPSSFLEKVVLLTLHPWDVLWLQ